MRVSLPHQSDPLPALRSFAYLWLLLLLLLLGLRFVPGLMPTGHLITLLYVLHAVILVSYLSSGWLRRRMGAAYLPAVLIFAAFGSQAILLWSVRRDMLSLMTEPRSFSNIIVIAHWLVLWPTVAVMIGWKYRLRHVAQFALAMGLFNIVVVELLFRSVRDISLGGVLAFGFLSVALLTIGYFVRQLSKAEQQQRQALLAANARLVQYAATLEQLTISRERNAMARELHDTLAHSLSSIAVQLETARAYWATNPEVSRQLVEQSLGATRNGLQETRQALQSLRASPLDDLGLLLALEHLARAATERAGLTLVLTLPDERVPLAPTVEQCLYRIAQEAIANATKHAAAQTLEISLILEPCIKLAIRDDGRGFSPDQVAQAGHYGLVGMRERAALGGGSLIIASQPQAGTTVTVTICNGGAPCA
ncbi:MAG: sensor histidine kinase [Roseiflexaceae bacterium]|nr:sensor histidine kinase [Roseiflexaceae bacterium]